MRGKHVRPSRSPDLRRIIPAHAGQTMAMVKRIISRSDHPRACGANLNHITDLTLWFGSSPRMRGKRLHFRARTGQRRIIPAHAGQTVMPLAESCPNPDHPRACGANPQLFTDTDFMFGSSPRMRGKPVRDMALRRPRRIIPAHAGQTPRRRPAAVARTDHPRACGANPDLSNSMAFDAGSSPRMRGKPDNFDFLDNGARIIPAHAGQTIERPCARHMAADHPRACGANFVSSQMNAVTCGSSPRMRGKHEMRRSSVGSRRIIPAHVGQTIGANAW